MKKLSKEQKLIILIAIVTIFIIIGIAFGINAIKVNIANEEYNSSNSSSNNGNLLPEYIKKGITLGGVTGTLEILDTSDATAIPEDILWGETAYVDGEKITGTKVVTVAQAKESQKIFEENTILIDDYGNSVKVPIGFKIAEDSATAVTGGVVIEDVSAEGATEYTKGSQFVWVPIGEIITDSEGNTTEIILGRYTFNTSTGKETLVQSAESWSQRVAIDNSWVELSSSTYGNKTSKNLQEFVTTSKASKG